MKRLWIIALTGILGMSFSFAADGEEEATTSALQNSAQVQKAESLATASQAAAEKEAQTNVSKAESDLSAAQTAVDEATAANTAAPTAETAAALEAAQADLATAQEALDSATGALAEVSGVSQSDIEGMRASGMGWGEIAHELGVHPGVLGLGHTKQVEKQERARNSKGIDADEATASSGGGKAFGLAGKASKDDGAKSNNAGGNGNKGSGNNGNGGGKK